MITLILIFKVKKIIFNHLVKIFLINSFLFTLHFDVILITPIRLNFYIILFYPLVSRFLVIIFIFNYLFLFNFQFLK